MNILFTITVLLDMFWKELHTLYTVCFLPLRYHNVGILVLFLHDINDIQLEFTKLNVYLKSRGGGYYLLNDVLSNMGSVSFSITW